MAAGRRLLLRQGGRVVLLGLQRAGHRGMYYARTGLYRSPLPPISAAQARRFAETDAQDGARDWAARWTHEFRRGLMDAVEGPLHAGRWTMEPGMPGWSVVQRWQHLRANDGDQGHISWFGYGDPAGGIRDVLPLRRLSPAGAARVKSFRRQVREGIAPPALLWWVSGLNTLAVLDGHDRIVAALAEETTPQVVVLAPAADPRWVSAWQQHRVTEYGHRAGALQAPADEGDQLAALHISNAGRSLAAELADASRAEGRTRAWLLPGGSAAWEREAAQVPGWLNGQCSFRDDQAAAADPDALPGD